MSTGPFDLSGRVALVTGGGGRLGRAFATALGTAGADVVVTGRDAERLAGTAAALGERAAGTVVADLAAPGGVDTLFDAFEREHARLDILVNNAGIAARAPFGELTAEILHELYAVDVVAPLLAAQRAAALMPDGGKIVNIGSIYGAVGVDSRLYEGAPDMVPASPAYVACKGALVALTRDLAVHLAPREIQVNLLSPGGIEAGQPESFQERYAARTPAGRMGRPPDVGGTLVWLCAAASDYVTGQNILVDGGFTAW